MLFINKYLETADYACIFIKNYESYCKAFPVLGSGV